MKEHFFIHPNSLYTPSTNIPSAITLYHSSNLFLLVLIKIMNLKKIMMIYYLRVIFMEERIFIHTSLNTIVNIQMIIRSIIPIFIKETYQVYYSLQRILLPLQSHLPNDSEVKIHLHLHNIHSPYL